MELNSCYTDLQRINPSANRTHYAVVNERKLYRAGQAVHVAVARFITIGELIADDNPEIKSDMYSFCRDARNAGKSIEHLCEAVAMEDMDHQMDLAKAQYDHTDIIIASRNLLSSITRVLLLVDIVVVKQLLTARRKVSKSLEKLESIMNFAEFVRAFSIFGMEMIELAYLTGSQQNRLKEERHRAQMYAARQLLEHSITILITSSRTSLVHCDCTIAKENRDTVFCQIRRAMDLIHFVIKDSIFESAWYHSSGQHRHHHHHHQPSNYHHHQIPSLGFKNGENGTIFSTLKHLNYLMEDLRHEYKINENSNNSCAKLKNYDKIYYEDCINHEHQEQQHHHHHQQQQHHHHHQQQQHDSYHRRWDGCSNLPSWLDAETIPLYNFEIKEQLLMTFEKLLEKTHDFTDSPYTSHTHRENILLHCDRCKLEFNKYFNKTLKTNQYNNISSNSGIDNDIDSVLMAVKNLSRQLVLTVTHQAAELNHSLNMSLNCLEDFRSAALQQDLPCLEEQLHRFHDYTDHIIDLCKLLQHIAFTETLQVQAKCLAMNLRIYAPQIVTAIKIFFKYADSEAAQENFEAFAKMWKWLTTEMNSLAKQVIRTTSAFGAESRTEIYNPPEPFDVTSYSLPKSVKTEPVVPAAAAAVGAAGIDAVNPAEAVEAGKFDDINNEDNNDILKRAKNMSAMAFSMYQFTKGSGTLKTTQDLFTQAEYFAEEANRLYKVLRQFSYQVPASPNKKDLLNILDRVPTFVQTLQFTVKDHTVGKAATFVKVDHVIKETKELMGVINSVVTKCFECAEKFKLDFTGISGDIAASSSRGDDCNNSGMGDSKGTTSSTEGSM